MRKTVLSVLLVALVVLSGCSALTGQGTPTSGSLSESVVLPEGGVAGEQSVVRIQLNNTASSEKQYGATLTADGTEVASDSVTVAAGETTTLSLTHTFEETGEHTISVANKTRTIQVYEDPRSFVEAQTDAVGTARIEETTRFDGVVNRFGEQVDVTATGSATIVKNYTAERLYEEGELETRTNGDSTTETSEEWVVDGMQYTKTVEDDGTTEYEQELSDEFDDTDIDDEEFQPYLRTEHTDTEYVYVLEANSSTDATRLWESIGDGGDGISEESLTYIYFELRYDRQTGRLNTTVGRVRGEGGTTFAELDMTVTQEYTEYGVDTDISVPSDVRDETEP